VAVALAGPYGSLQFAPDTTMPAPPPLSFVQARCPSCHLTNSIKALKALPSVQRITSKLPRMTNTTVCAENVASEIFHPSTTKLGMETHRVIVA